MYKRVITSFFCLLIVNALPLLLGLTALPALGQEQLSSDALELPPNRVLEGELTGTEQHLYKVDLQKGEFFQVRVEQKGVDVVLRLMNLSGTQLARMDSPNGKEGYETLTFVVTESAVYTLTVSGLDAKAERGLYTIRRETPRMATAQDKRRVEVETLFVAAAEESAAGPTDTAIKKWEVALAGWRELRDEYMAELAARELRGTKSAKAKALFEVATQLAKRGDKSSLKTSLPVFTEARRLTREIGEKKGEAICLISLAGVSQALGDQLQALEYYRQALPLWIAVKDSAEEAATLYALGNISYSLKETRKALEYFQQGVEPFKATHDKAGEATMLSNIGSCYMALGERETALDYFNRSLTLWRLLEDKKGEARILMNLGALHSEMGEMREALNYYQQALTIFKAVKDQPAEANVLVNIGNVYSNFEEKRAALEPYREALAIYRRLDDKQGVVEVLDELGFTSEALGEKEKAIEYFLEALPLYKLTSDEWKERRTLANLGSAYLDLGEKRKALEAHQKGLDLSREAQDELGIGTQLNNVGMVYMALGDRRKARDEYFKEALKVFVALKDKYREAWTHMLLGAVYTDLGDDLTALEYYERARSLYRDSKDKGREANALHSIGVSYERLGEKQLALQAYEEGMRIVGSASTRSSLQLSLSGIYLDSGDTQRGLEYKTQALAENVADSKDGEAIVLSNLGSTWLELGNARLGVFYGKQAVNKYQELRQALQGMDYETQKAFLQRLDTVYNSLALSLIAVGRLAEAVQVLNLYQDQQYFDFDRNPNEPAKRIELSPREAALAAKYERAGEAVRQSGRKLVSLTRRIGDDQPTEQQLTQRHILEAEYKTAEEAFVAVLDEIKSELSKPAAGQDEAPAAKEVSDLQQSLHDISEGRQKAVAIYTAADAKRFHLLLVAEDGIKTFDAPVKSKEFDEKVLRFYALLRSRRYDPRPLGKQLYDIILKPAEAELKRTGARTLLWALRGNLRYVPMAALSPDGTGYLVEQYQNVVFTRSERRRIIRAASKRWAGVGFGNSEARKVELNGDVYRFPELKGVTTELRAIFGSPSAQGILPGAVFTDAAFTRESFFEALKQHLPLVHVASHFFFRPGDGSRSFLLPGAGPPLTLSDLKERIRPFDDVELLTLSACNTAAQRADADGREIDGFAELAQRLGANAVLATLWPASDTSTPQLMSSFYRLRQAGGGMTKAEALREAQLDLLNGTLRIRRPRLPGGRGATGEPEVEVQIVPPPGGGERADNDPRRDTGQAVFVDQRDAVPYRKNTAKPFAHPYYWAPFVLFGNSR